MLREIVCASRSLKCQLLLCTLPDRDCSQWTRVLFIVRRYCSLYLKIYHTADCGRPHLPLPSPSGHSPPLPQTVGTGHRAASCVRRGWQPSPAIVMMQQTIRVFPQQHGRSVPSHLRSAFKADAFRINSVEVIGERPTIGRLPTGHSFHQQMKRYSCLKGSFLLHLSRACLGILCISSCLTKKLLKTENRKTIRRVRVLTPAKP